MHVVAIKTLAPQGNIASVEPQLVFLVQLQFQRGKRLPLDVTIQVRAEEFKLLGVARALGLEGAALTLEAVEDGSSSNGDITRNVRVVMPLSQRQLDYLERIRSTHPKRDIALQCLVDVRCLASKVVNSWFQLEEPRGSPATVAPVHYNRQHGLMNPFTTNISNMWILSGDKGRAFLECENYQQLQHVTIPSSDWIHDYVSVWNETRHVLIELPQPQLLTSAQTPELQERVNAAIAAVDDATQRVVRGDWTDAVADLRPVWELIRNHADVRALLGQDGYTSDAVDALMATIDHQFQFASKFIHRTDRTGRRVNPEMIARREDAELCYSFAVHVLNLVTRKTKRLSAP